MAFDLKDFESVTCPRCRMLTFIGDLQKGLCFNCRAVEFFKKEKEKEHKTYRWQKLWKIVKRIIMIEKSK